MGAAVPAVTIPAEGCNVIMAAVAAAIPEETAGRMME